MAKILTFISYLNVPLAVCTSIIACIICYIFNWNPNIAVIYIPFSLSLFVSTWRRLHGNSADLVEHPKRFLFGIKYENEIIIISLLHLTLSFIIVIQQSLWTLVWFSLPLITQLFYPQIRNIYLPFAKNLFFAVIKGTGIFLVGSFFQEKGIHLLILFFYFSALFFIHSVLLDTKNIKGDFWSGISTLPLAIGIKKSKMFCMLANLLLSFLLIVVIILGALPIRSVILLLLNIYIFTLTFFLFKKSKISFYNLGFTVVFLLAPFILFIYRMSAKLFKHGSVN